MIDIFHRNKVSINLKFKINEKIKYKKRNLIACKICKSLRRKQEHFVQFVNQ